MRRGGESSFYACHTLLEPPVLGWGGADQIVLFVEGGDSREILEDGTMGLADVGHYEPGGVYAQSVATHR